MVVSPLAESTRDQWHSALEIVGSHELGSKSQPDIEDLDDPLVDVETYGHKLTASAAALGHLAH